MIDWLICWARRKPYRKGHLFHADGSLYMERWSLFEMRWLSARLHHITTHDYDRALHDHPWNFASIVLRGGYVENRPETVEPCFEGDAERCSQTYRMAGSIAFRRATDRHAITSVLRNTYSLFIYGRALQWWGFYTPSGKVYFRDYASVHNCEARPVA